MLNAIKILRKMHPGSKLVIDHDYDTCCQDLQKAAKELGMNIMVYPCQILRDSGIKYTATLIVRQDNG